MLTPAGAASGAGRAAGIPIVSPAPAVLVPSLVLTQPRNSPGQTLPEQGLLRDPFPCPSSSWAPRGGSSATELGNCVARRGDSGVVAAQAILKQPEPPHIVRLGHHRRSLKSFLNPNEKTLQQAPVCMCCMWALGRKQTL